MNQLQAEKKYYLEFKDDRGNWSNELGDYKEFESVDDALDAIECLKENNEESFEDRTFRIKDQDGNQSEMYPKVWLYTKNQDFEECAQLMDDEIREEINNEFFGSGMTNQEFLDEYLERHWEKFGENFEI